MSEADEILFRMRESTQRLSHNQPQSVVPPIDDTPERTRAQVRLLARSRISQTLRQLRAAHGLSYEEIQERTGISQQVLFDLEFRDRRLSLTELRVLAACFGVGVNDIIGIDID